ADPSSRLKLIAMGGSTTECMLLSDGEDWPELMRRTLVTSFPTLWVNNAGFDGHSTYGHLALMRKAIPPLHPDVVLLLVGMNDVAWSDEAAIHRGAGARVLLFFKHHSCLYRTGCDLWGAYHAHAIRLAHQPVDVRTVPPAVLSGV